MFACASLPFGLFYDVSEYLLTEFGRHLELIGFTPRRYLVLHNGESFILCGSACLKQTWQANSKGRFRIAAFFFMLRCLFIFCCVRYTPVHDCIFMSGMWLYPSAQEHETTAPMDGAFERLPATYALAFELSRESPV